MDKKKFDKDCEDRCFDTDILTLKIFDQCRQKECINIGPLISDEKCECIILTSHLAYKDFGSVILPGHPIKSPLEVAEAKVLDESFRLKQVDFFDSRPSQIKKCFWTAKVRYVFEFKLQLLDIKLRPLKIICCSVNSLSYEDNRVEKDFIKAKVSYEFEVFLYGGNEIKSQVFSDIFEGNRSSHYNIPHFIIDISAYPLEVTLKDPCCHEDCDDISNDPYYEPYKLVFITVGISSVIRLVRFESMAINSIDCKNPPLCKFKHDPCETFFEMGFPDDLFFEDRDLI